MGYDYKNDAEYYGYGDEIDGSGNGTFNYDYSNPVDCPSPSLPLSNIYVPILYFILFLSGFLGNLFVITIMGSRGKRGSRLVDTFVVNLALADLVFVLTLPLWAVSASQDGHWNFGDASCKLSSYIIAVNRSSNILFLTCMSVDRYVAVVKLMDARFIRSSLCIHISCVTVWCISLVMGTPSLIFRRVWTNDANESFCVEDKASDLFLGLSMFTVFITFVLPVLIILLCYCSVLNRLRQHCVATGNTRNEARLQHSLKMVLIIIMAFMVSWLPYNIFKMIDLCYRLANADQSCYYKSVLSQGLVLSSCLAFLNSCVNPAIYFFLDHHFRRQAKNLYLICICRRGMYQGYNSSNSLTSNVNSESYGITAPRRQLQSFELKH